MRIGHGYDVHKFTENRKCIIGGVEIPFEKGLLGHSDADVLLHAICDALLGAAALGDIGKHFPDNDNSFLNIDSRIYCVKRWNFWKKRVIKSAILMLRLLPKSRKWHPIFRKWRKILQRIVRPILKI